MAQSSFTHKVIQGFSVIWTVFIVDGNGNPVVFAGTEPLAAEVWTGGQQAVIFSPAVAFNTPSAGSIDVTYSVANTATVPQGYYDLIISRTDTTTALAYGFVLIQSAPGTASGTLTTIPFVRAALADFALTATQIEFLPQTIVAASDAVRRWCGDRDFIQQNYREEYPVFLDGTIMLNQPPNWLIRVQGYPYTTLTVQNISSSVQEAYVSGMFSGDQHIGLTFLGLNFNSISNGQLTVSQVQFATPGSGTIAVTFGLTAVTFSTTQTGLTGSYLVITGDASDGQYLVASGSGTSWVLSSTYGGSTALAASWGVQSITTINALATAVNALGNGWSAVADSFYGNFPVSELIDPQLSRGAYTGIGATWDVYTEDLGSDAKIDPIGTGLVWLGRQYKGTGIRWGPDYEEFDSPYLNTGKVRVTYNAGFVTVPLIVQKTVANITKNLIAMLTLDPTLASEKAEQYSYVARQQVELIPEQDRQALSMYRIHHA